MLEKKKTYQRAKFSPAVIRQAIALYGDLCRPRLEAYFPKADSASHIPSVRDIMAGTTDEHWQFDSLDEAFAEYRKDNCVRAHLRAFGYPGSLVFDFTGRSTTISVAAPERGEIERLFSVFEENLERSLMPVVQVEAPVNRPVTIFIGHGRSPLWRDLKDHLQDKHRLLITAYETGIRTGHSIQEVLAEMVNDSSLALLVHTAEDRDSEGALHARENVIHETGLFQGRLGLRRTIIIREEGCEPFSNISGTQELRFSQGNIREVFGDVIAIIRREFNDAL